MKIIRRYREVGWKLFACTILYWAWVRKIGPLETGSMLSVSIGGLVMAGLMVVQRFMHREDLKSPTNHLLESAGYYTQYNHLLLFVVFAPVFSVGIHGINATVSCYFVVLQTLSAILYLYHGYRVEMRAQDDESQKNEHRDTAIGIKYARFK